jgi:hypothetical protein
LRARASSKSQPSSQRPTSSPTANLLSVCDGRSCIGHILARGRSGFEAFGADDKSLGIFPDEKAAADALSAAAKGTAP